jgi:hypothetical protein
MAVLPSPKNLDLNVVALARAIRHNESGGNYAAKGQTGEGGAYQFMPAVWKEWAAKYIKDPNAPQTAENQNAVAYLRIKERKDAGLTPAQILSEWNSGSTIYEGKKGVNSSGAAYDVPTYVRRGIERFQEEVTTLGGRLAPNSALPPQASSEQAPTQHRGLFARLKDAASNRLSEAKKLLPGGTYSTNQNALDTTVQAAGQAAGFVGDVFGEAFLAAGRAILPKRAEDAVANTTQKVVGKIIGTAPAQRIIKSYDSYKQDNPVQARNLAAVGNIASLVPIGKGANLSTKAAGRGIVATGETVAAGGRIAKSTGKAVFSSAITPNVAEAERILTYEAKTPFLKRAGYAIVGKEAPGKPTLRADTAIEKGIFGRQKDIGVQAAREADKLWNQTIAPAVEASEDVITKDELFAPALARIEKTAEPGRKQALRDAFDAIDEEYKGFDSFTLQQAQAVKRGLDEFTPEKIFRGKPIANEYRTLKADMANAIRQKTYESLKDQDIRQAYLDYGNLAELRKIGVRAISEAGTKGGFGGFWTSMWDSATVPVKTVSGQVLYRVGNAFEFLGNKGIKTFGPRDFLANWKNWPEIYDGYALEHKQRTFFAVHEGPYDTFDNIRAALWLFRDKKNSVLAGSYWYVEWGNPAGGVIPKSYNRNFGQPQAHAFKVRITQKMLNGEPYLAIQQSYGPAIGDHGTQYFPREVVNREWKDFGAFMFVDMDPEEARQAQLSWMQKLLASLATILKSFLPLATPPEPEPYSREPEPTLIVEPEPAVEPPTPKPESLQDMARRVCREERISASMTRDILATIHGESGWNPKARGRNYSKTSGKLLSTDWCASSTTRKTQRLAFHTGSGLMPLSNHLPTFSPIQRNA